MAGIMSRKSLIVAGGAVLALILGGFAAWLLVLDSGGDGGRLPAGRANELGLALTPLVHDAEGVPVDAHFVLTSHVDLDGAAVRGAVRVTPEVELQVQQSTPREFHLLPAKPLEPGTVYRFTFAGPSPKAPLASWAFQVRSPLRVVQTLPANEANGVPLNSGIEITFSHDGVVDPASFVEITPRPEGHFEQHKRTLVFVPRTLAPETIYSVRVRPGLTVTGSDLTLAAEQVFQFETASLQERGGGIRFEFLHKLGEWGTKDAPVVSIQTSDGSLTELGMEVFAYPALDPFLADLEARERVPYWAQYSRNKVVVDTARLAAVLSFTAPVEGSRSTNQFGVPLTRLFVRMPDRLPPGYYLLQTRYRNEPVQAWLQITDVATYLAVSSTSTLVWVNDVSTGGPIQGATIRLSGKDALGSSDAQGVSEFKTPAQLLAKTSGSRIVGLSYFTVTDRAGRVAVVPLSPVVPVALGGRCGAFTDFSSAFGSYDHWNFAVTDRPLYQPNDTVRFWGVALPRDGGLETDLYAQLQSYAAGGPVAYQTRVDLTGTDWGTFTGELPLVAADEGYHTLTIRNAAGVIATTQFQVAPYVKPAYRIGVTPSARAVFDGEEVDVGISAAFFDGTPLPGLNVRYGGAAGDGSLTTGADGKASVRFTARVQDRAYYGAVQISVAPLGLEEGEISGEAYIVVFPAAVQLSTTSSTFANGRITVSGEALRVDPSRFQNAADLYASRSAARPPHLTGGAAGQAITATVTPQSYVAIEVDERYDFINKVSRKVYRYEPRLGLPFTVSAVSDATGKYSVSFAAEEGSFYNIRLRTVDDRGREAATATYAGARSFSSLDTGGIARIAVAQSDELFYAPPQSLKLGDQISVTFFRGSNATPSGGLNRYLFYESQRGIRSFKVQDSPVYQETFSDRHIPSAVIGGVYFNGFTYIEAQYGPTLAFNPESRRLTIEIRSLEQSYEPGTDAAVEVRVRDAGGRGVEAEVNLAAVDEALFALRDFQSYQTDILGRLYQILPSGIVRTYASHQYPPEFIEIGGRGGNGGGPRDDFADVAHYSTVRTDASGAARVSFKLPDNVTSWRLTAYGMTKDLKAGRGAGSVVASLPFFVDVSLNEDYLTGETPVARFRSFGGRLAPGSDVDYTLSIPTLGVDSQFSGRAFEDAFFPLPALSPGTHKVTVRASSGNLADGVARDIEVVASRVTVPRLSLYEDVGPRTRVEGSKDGRTTLTFMDAGQGRYYELLVGLSRAYGDRVDQALARVLGARLLREHFGEEVPAPAFDGSIYVRFQPGIPAQPGSRRAAGVSILPYADADLAVTARIAAAAPGLFDTARLRDALRKAAADDKETPERQAIALYGLAALQEPVLVGLQALLPNPDLGWRGRLYLALGLHALGDDAGAALILEQMLAQSGEKLQPWLRLRAGDDVDDSLEATALAAVLAAGTGDPRAEALMRYVRENPSDRLLVYLDELQFLQEGLARLDAAPVKFTYEAGVGSQEVTLQKGAVRSLSMSPQEVAALRVTVKEGRLALVARYDAPAATTLASSPDLEIVRTVLVRGQPVTSIPATGLVEVRLEVIAGPQAPEGCYQVTDRVPSGLKVVTSAIFYRAFAPPPARGPGFVIRPYLADPAKISFCVGKGAPWVSYYARASQRGSYTWEPAVVHNQRAPSVIAFSEPLRIRVE